MVPKMRKEVSIYFFFLFLYLSLRSRGRILLNIHLDFRDDHIGLTISKWLSTVRLSPSLMLAASLPAACLHTVFSLSS